MTADAAAEAKRVAVLYFEDQSPNHSLSYLADGLTEDLIAQLSTVQALDVVSRNGVARVPRPGNSRATASRVRSRWARSWWAASSRQGPTRCA